MCPQREAERQRVFDKWNELLGGKPPPTMRVLRLHCKVLIDKPHTDRGALRTIYLPILQDWFAKPLPPSVHAPQSKLPISWTGLSNSPEKIPPSIARKQVAETFGMSVAAVKKDHLNSENREKSRTNRGDICPRDICAAICLACRAGFGCIQEVALISDLRRPNDPSAPRSDLATARSRRDHWTCPHHDLARRQGRHISETCQAHIQHHRMVPNGPG